MNTATGAMSRATVRAGVRALSWWDGLRITLDIGFMLGRGAGRGWKMSLGDSPRSTMDAGHTSTADGSGCLDRWSCVRCGLRRWLPLSAAGLDSTSRPALVWDGSRWLREKFMYRGIT